MSNIIYVVRKHILVRLFLAVTLCVVAAMVLGSGLKTQAASSVGNFDQPIIVKNSAITSDNQNSAATLNSTPAKTNTAAQVPAQPQQAATSLDKALRSMAATNPSAASTGGAKASDKAAADKSGDSTVQQAAKTSDKTVAEVVATPPATPRK